MKVLGKMVKYHSIEPTAERIAAIRDYSQPTTVGELRSFLGMMAQIASHVLIHKIAEINLLHTAASNLHTSVSNVEWTPELSTAFNVVKDTASKPETLVPFDETRQVFLLCDASDDGYGAWLCHLAPDTNRLQPIDIFSGAWTAAQRNYTVPEKEAAALRLCCERWRYELLGRTTIVLCDNNAVVQLLANGTTSKAARVRNTIADMIGFDFVMLHIPTHENLVADALSRDPRFGAAFADAVRALSTTRATTEADELRVQSMAISLPVAPIVDIHSPSSATPPPPATAGIGAALDYLAPPFSDTRAALINLVEHQQRDPALATLRRVANNESLPTNPRPSPSIRRQWRRATQLKPFFDAAHAGALFVVPPGANYRRLVVPDGQRDNVIAEIHGPAHINAVATAKVAATLFWWPGMDAQIKNTIRGCAACQRVNAPRTRTPGNLGDVERDRVPIRLTEWEIDTFHVGHELGSGLAISVVERFSGFVMSKVVPSSSASDAIAAFTDLVLRPFGVPRRIFSDNGSEFLGVFAQELRRLGIEHIVGLPDNHHAVARVERHNRDRNNRLAHMYLRNGQRRPESNAALQHWLDIADTVANSIPTSSGYSPHELLFAQRRIVSVAALVPDDMLRAIADIGTDATTDLVSQIRLHQTALAVLDEARAHSATRCDRTRSRSTTRRATRLATRRSRTRSHSARIARRRRQAQLAPRVLRRLVRDVARSRHRTSRSASHDSSADIERSRRATNPHARRHEHDHGSLVRRSQFPRRLATRQRAHGQSAAHRRRTTGAQHAVARAIHCIRRRRTSRAHGADDRAPSRCQASSHARTGASHFGQPRPRDSSVRSTRSTRSATSCGGGCSGRRGRALVCNSDRRSRTGGPFTNYVYTCATLDDHCIDKHTHYTFEQSVQRAQTVLLHRRLSRPVRPDRRHL
jgi:hypothetical protein